MSRLRKIEELRIWNELKDSEKKWCVENKNSFTTLVSLLNGLIKHRAEIGGKKDLARIPVLSGHISILEQTKFNDDEIIYEFEKELLGIPISCSKLDTCDKFVVNNTCKNINKDVLKIYQEATLGVEVVDVLVKVIKNGDNAGRNMARITVEDESGQLDGLTIFAKEFEEAESLLIPGNTVAIKVYKDKKGGYIIKSVTQI